MAMWVETEGDASVVRVVGQLTVGNRRELQQHVTAAVDGGARSVAVDLADAGYVDSSGLATLVLLARQVQARGGVLRLTSLNEDVRTLLALTHLDSVLCRDPEAPAAA
jgi:anti-sigma B factor antagonist